MRIGLDARFYGGAQNTGLGRYTEKLLEYLVKLDQENEYIIFLKKDNFDLFNPKNPRFKKVLADYHWYTFAEQIYLPRQIKQAHLDFMHFPHYNVPLLYRGPFVVTIHDLTITHFPTQRATTLGPLTYRLKHLAYTLVIRSAVKRAKKIIAVSFYTRNDLAQTYKLDKKKIAVTYEAADLISRRTDLDPNHVLEKYHIVSPYLIYVGNAYPHKNLEIMPEALRILAEKYGQKPNLVLVGKEDYFYQRLKQEVAKTVPKDRIIFCGYVPDEELPVLYQEATAYIFPSLYEGFGLPPLEAMQYGLPVLSSRASCLPEILQDAALYFDPNDPHDIADKIAKIIDDQGLAANLAQLGKQHVQRFSWQKMTADTLLVYNKFNEHVIYGTKCT